MICGDLQVRLPFGFTPNVLRLWNRKSSHKVDCSHVNDVDWMDRSTINTIQYSTVSEMKTRFGSSHHSGLHDVVPLCWFVPSGNAYHMSAQAQTSFRLSMSFPAALLCDQEPSHLFVSLDTRSALIQPCLPPHSSSRSSNSPS